MNISVVKEIELTGSDKRAIILPNEIKRIIATGHKVFISKGMAEGICFPDNQYKKAGAIVLNNAEELFSKGLIVKLRAPSENEFLMMNNNILFCMLHIEQNPQRIELIRNQKIRAIAMENVVNEYEERLIECSNMAGKQAMLSGFNLAMKLPDECNVLVLGYGKVSTGAIDVANSLDADVKILRKEEYKDIEYHLKNIDILVNGIKWPKYHRDRKDYVITKNMLNLLNPGAVIVDISVDYPNPIETCRPTYPNDPWYEVDGVKHICIYGYPALMPISSSERYSRQVVNFVIDIAENGIRNMSAPLKKALLKPNKL